MQKTYPSLRDMGGRWPSNYVARSEVGRFTGGILNPRSMANLDSKKKGPQGRIRVGRKIAYPVENLIAWLEEKAEKL